MLNSTACSGRLPRFQQSQTSRYVVILNMTSEIEHEEEFSMLNATITTQASGIWVRFEFFLEYYVYECQE